MKKQIFKNAKTIFCNKKICTLSQPKIRPCLIISQNKTNNQSVVIVLTSKQAKGRLKRPNLTTYGKSSLKSFNSFINVPLRFINASHTIYNDYYSKLLKGYTMVKEKDAINYFFALDRILQIYFIARPFKDNQSWKEAFLKGALNSFITRTNKTYIDYIMSRLDDNEILIKLDNINDDNYSFGC